MTTTQKIAGLTAALAHMDTEQATQAAKRAALVKAYYKALADHLRATGSLPDEN